MSDFSCVYSASMPKVPWDNLLEPRQPVPWEKAPPLITITEDNMHQACEHSMRRSRQLADLDLVIAYLGKIGATTEVALLQRVRSEL